MTQEHMEEYKYKDYLDAWAARYGDESTGVATFYRYGKEFSVPVEKMNENQFELQVAILRYEDKKFSEAAAEGETSRMDAALERMFLSEIVLLI